MIVSLTKLVVLSAGLTVRTMENKKPSTAVVEFHGFKDNSYRFIIKEFVIVNRSFKSHLVFDPPYSLNTFNFKMQRTVRWLSRRHHLIQWEERGLLYDENIIRTLCKPFPVLFTKGL